MDTGNSFSRLISLNINLQTQKTEILMELSLLEDKFKSVYKTFESFASIVFHKKNFLDNLYENHATFGVQYIFCSPTGKVLRDSKMTMSSLKKLFIDHLIKDTLDFYSNPDVELDLTISESQYSVLVDKNFLELKLIKLNQKIDFGNFLTLHYQSLKDESILPDCIMILESNCDIHPTIQNDDSPVLTLKEFYLRNSYMAKSA